MEDWSMIGCTGELSAVSVNRFILRIESEYGRRRLSNNAKIRSGQLWTLEKPGHGLSNTIAYLQTIVSSARFAKSP